MILLWTALCISLSLGTGNEVMAILGACLISRISQQTRFNTPLSSLIYSH